MELSDDKVALAASLLADLSDMPAPREHCPCAPCAALWEKHRSHTFRLARDLSRDLERLADKHSLAGTGR